MKAPFALLLLVLFLFGRKKPPREEEKPPQSNEPFPMPEMMRKSVTESDVAKARERLRVSSLERDIIGDALTRIYEAEAKGLITENDRTQLVQRYKVDLKRVDAEVDTHKKVVDLHELESAKEDLLKSFYEKLMEIDVRISQIRPELAHLHSQEVKLSAPTLQAAKVEAQPSTTSPPANNKEKPRDKPKNKAEERLEAIREEVLKAMERLEQIETEG